MVENKKQPSTLNRRSVVVGASGVFAEGKQTMVKIEVNLEIAAHIQREIETNEELFGGTWTPSRVIKQWIVRYEDNEVQY